MSNELLRRRIETAAGKTPAPLVLKNARVVNVFTETIDEADVAIVDGMIAGVGSYRGETEVDCAGRIVCPGFIDAHTHMESTMLTPAELARVIVPWGTTGIIADPHELVNVCGAQGMEYFLNATQGLPLDVYFMLPSCVPATAFETSGACFTAAEMQPFIHHPRVLGLGEVMSYPAVVCADEQVLEKLTLAGEMLADGHAPGLTGAALQAYVSAGIHTEHECTTFAEAREKLAAGMAVLVREGSAAKNLTALITGWQESGLPGDRILFCTDDKHLDDCVRGGNVRWNVRQAISLGVPPVTAIKMATWNTAQVYGLRGVGAVAPGYRADLVLLDDVKDLRVHAVYKNGKDVAELLENVCPPPVPEALLHSVQCSAITPEQLALRVGETAHCIALIPYQIATGHVCEPVPSENGLFKPNADYTKLCVVERHGKNGNLAVCPLKGYGIVNGAVATTVAHDSHNIIAAGDNDGDLALAINRLREIGGGFTLASGGKILGELPLPVGGLMSNAPWQDVRRRADEMMKKAAEMGVPYHVDPFVSLSFMALPVIPALRLTDMGLFDVEKFALIQ